MIVTVTSHKRSYMPLLLMGDESEAMINRYLDRGTLYVKMLAGSPVSVCVVTIESPDVVEIKNLAVLPQCRRQGIGSEMLRHVELMHKGMTLMLGTGETPSTLRFYKAFGFRYSHLIPDFFTTNYPHPIIEEGITLRHMIYLVKRPGL
ncbi:MAG: GNAT family N-acetyltransferase [Muribaculaceae bacterium]|nr:GNAT family N-acetyltransferase [Muribaculaceae bacterium]